MIENLRLRGMTGIKRGMGQNEIEISFAGRHGLIAFDGTNGIGKSSTLDHLSPYAMIPSREGSLSNHCFLRNSEKELSFTHGGNSYRTLIKIDSESGKSEGFAWKNGDPQVNGKISSYHRWAVQEFGSPELFFSSIFCAQGSRKISDMTVGTLKSLFVEFLRLERYEAWADAAKQAGNVQQGKLAGLDSRIGMLATITGSADELTHKLHDENGKLDTAGIMKEDYQDKVAALRDQVDALKETINKNALALERKRDLRAQIIRMEADFAKEKEASDLEIKTLADKWRELSGAIRAVDAILQNREKIEKASIQVTVLETEAIGIQAKIEAGSVELPAHQQKVHDLETQIVGLRQQIKDLDPATDPENQRLGRLVAEAEGQVAAKEMMVQNLDLDASLARLVAEVVSLERMTKVGDGIDADCQSLKCAAIKSVNEARTRLPEAIKERDARNSGIEAKRTELARQIVEIKEQTAFVLTDKAARLAQIEESRKTVNESIKVTDEERKNAHQAHRAGTETLDGYRKSLATKRTEIAQQKALAGHLPEIQVAIARKADLEKQLQEVTTAGTEKKEAWKKREAAAENQVDLLRNQEAALMVDETAELSLSQTQAEIKEIETIKIPSIEKEIQGARERIATLQAELTRIEAAERELAEATTSRESLSLKISRWRYLQQACGKNGLQALEIDGAAPLISEQANKLLYLGYGPQFSIRIDTQDEEGREDLDIKVISEFGEDSLKQKSGGEKVWLLHPIRLAMTLLSKEKSGRDWDYACFDEITGALDSKGASTNFMSMYAPFMQVGGFRQIFFITHQDECLSYADHILSFEKGKNPSWR